VALTVASTKLRADGKGEEKPVPNGDLFEIGVFGNRSVQQLIDRHPNAQRDAVVSR
jgi:hypothetical protein